MNAHFSEAHFSEEHSAQANETSVNAACERDTRQSACCESAAGGNVTAAPCTGGTDGTDCFNSDCLGAGPAQVCDRSHRDTARIAPGSASETQLAEIRDVMMRAFASGVWLTLGEIAEATEYGEASISAQLRHLRKKTHGRYRVEKRQRKDPNAAGSTRVHAGEARKRPVWEYRVLPPVLAARALE